MKTIQVILLLSISTNAFSIDVEDLFIRYGLINVSDIDSSIKINLVNSNPKNNFFREDYYNGLQHAYLQKEIALKLSRAQTIMKGINLNYTLLIMDAARPNSISWKMYNKMKDTKFKKYVADPRKGSMHNYGVAVDVTIYDLKNNSFLDMGYTPFFKNSLEIYIQYLRMKITGNKLSKDQKGNRELLKSIMLRAGFYPLSFEWWHFDGLKTEEAKQKYRMIK